MTSITADAAPPAPINRPMILASVMLGTILVALDQTIANVALPHIAGSVSASQDQIAWVLTSYIVAGAIFTPITGWLVARLGRRKLLLGSVIGFIATSALCGAAQNLPEIVLFRAVQGIFGAPLMPLSQMLILDIYSPKERGPAMAIWGVGVMVAPIVGPALGGWLTEDFSWRWVFYINLPVGALAVLGLMTFVPELAIDKTRRFDFAGFLLLGVAIASLQLVFDRGQSKDWFSSVEIIAEAAIAFIALWISLAHSLTSKRPFLPIQIFKDLNYSTASVMGILVGVVILSVTALLPLMLQGVYGFSALQAGMLSSPRGFGSIISMLVVGRLIGRVNIRVLMIVGLSIFATAFFHLSTFTVDTSQREIALNGVLQGLGTGLLFLPLNTMAFGTMPANLRGDATAFFTLVRNLGASAGISGMLAILTVYSVNARATLVQPYSVDNAVVAQGLPQPYSLTDPTGIAILSGSVDHQAAMLGYTQIFHLMFIVTLCMMPLVFLMRTPKAPPPQDEPQMVAEH